MKVSLIILMFFIPCLSNGQERYAILINEIMPDPSPVAGLPSAEWIELKNRSADTIDLRGWRLMDGTGQSGLFPYFLLAPDSLLIVCSQSASAALSPFGTTLAISSFPSLDNNGELIQLKSADERIIHAVNYQLNWYGNELKSEGGWSLEIKDPQFPCTGRNNWSASTNSAGGTPGRINSINGPSPDEDPPELLHAFAPDSITIILVFNEPVDSLTSSNASTYAADGLEFLHANAMAPLFNQVIIQLHSAMQQNRIYEVKTSGILDCHQNRATNQFTRVGRPLLPQRGDLVINEILFNPGSNSDDYVEIFNPGEKIIDAAQLFLANRNSMGAINSINVTSTSPLYIFPGDYILISSNVLLLSQHYLVKNKGSILEIPSLPSYPDEEGTVVLLNAQGLVTDEVHYYDDWHFPLINNKEGVSLERINPQDSSQKKSNWMSAASTAGYGTPGYQNSQFLAAVSINASLEISPAVFSPDQDGNDDQVRIFYRFAEPGYVANLSIFDSKGRLVRLLARNELLGTSGHWIWDGLGNSRNKLFAGIYILHAEFFNLRGKKQQFKKPLILLLP